MPKIENLIRDLADDLKNPSDSKHWFSQYWFSWISCFSIMAIFTYLAAVFFPQSIHLPLHANNTAFWVEVILWFTIAFSSAAIAYKSSIPGRSKRISVNSAYAFSLLLIGFLLVRWSPSAFAHEFLDEMRLEQGPCGVFVMIAGSLSAIWMFLVIRRAAPVNLGFTSAWSAVSVGALGSMFMHLVCTHESTTHVFVWHMFPLFLLISISGVVGKKIMRW